MSGDLVSLRMVAISAVPAEQELWQQGAAMSSVPVEFSAHDTTTGGVLLARGLVDICLIDDALPAGEKEAVIAIARTHKRGPLVFISGPSGSVPAGSVVPAACWISKYWPGFRVTAGSVVTVHDVPVEAAYWIDQPLRFCAEAPAL